MELSLGDRVLITKDGETDAYEVTAIDFETFGVELRRGPWAA